MSLWNSQLSLWGLFILYKCIDFVGKVICFLFHEWRPSPRLPKITNDILLLSAGEIIQSLQSGRFTCTQVCDAYIQRQKEVNSLLNAVVCDRYAAAQEEAGSIDQRIETARKKGGSDAVKQLWKDQPLLGVPFTVKECFALKGCPNCSGLATRASHRADSDAEIVSRVKSNGVICLAVTNVCELCMWWETNSSVYGRCCCPYDIRRIPGGSSGGEGAIIAAGGSVAGVGADIGGSIRIPSHFNGIFGHKPSRGVLPLDGEFPSHTPESQKFEQSGPMCRYANDLRLFMSAMAGKDLSEQLKLHEKSIDLCNVEFYYMEDMDHILTTSVEHDIRQGLQKVIQQLKVEGCSVTQVTHLDRMKNAPFYWFGKISLSSASVSFADLLTEANGTPFSLWKELAKWFTGRSTHTWPVLALVALEKVRRPLTGSYNYLSEQCDILQKQMVQLLSEDLPEHKHRVFLLPTHPTTALYHGQSFFRLFNFGYTSIFNVFGLPATSVPLGLDRQGLPFGVQVVSSAHQDAVCLSVASHFERLFGGWVQP